MKKIYLDNAASTPIDDEVLSSMLPYFKEAGNPSALHKSGRQAKQAIEDARERVARCLGANPSEIIFTGSGTESDNLALLGAAHANKDCGRHIIVSAIEHKAVLEAAETLHSEGFEVSIARVDEFGMVDIPSVLSMVREDTILISIMLGNNEIGTTQPIEKLSQELKKHRMHTELPYLHTDACQAVGYLQIDVKNIGVDLLTLNGSKIYGPKGVGVLYKKKQVKMSPLIVGGLQEHRLRAGTESVAVIVGMANALEKAETLQTEEALRLRKLRTYFIEKLYDEVPDIIINGHQTEALPHIVHVTVPKIEGESVVLMLDEAGIEAATGSACSSSDLQPSHVLRAIGQELELIHGSVRFSFGRDTDMKDLDIVVAKFSEIVQRLKSMSALTSKHYERGE